jgi:uncharacterized protein YkwD
MPQHLTRLVSMVAAAAVAISVLGTTPAPAAATTDLTVAEAEQEMVGLLNADRKNRGLLPLRTDSRLMSIARSRSKDMASKGYFSHTSPSGVDVFDLLSNASVRWYAAGEIIAWNSWPTLALSAQVANSAWMNSTGHRNIILSTTYNYFGIGLAVASSGRKYWTGVFIKGPDRTGAWARPADPSVGSGTLPTNRRVKFSWTGGDVRLPVLTSGFYRYQVQRRINDGSWANLWTSTTNTTYAVNLALGSKVEIRVRARDKAGNWGSWRIRSVSL